MEEFDFWKVDAKIKELQSQGKTQEEIIQEIGLKAFNTYVINAIQELRYNNSMPEVNDKRLNKLRSKYRSKYLKLWSRSNIEPDNLLKKDWEFMGKYERVMGKLIQELFDNNNMKKLNPAIPYKGGEISIQASEFHYSVPKADKRPYSAVEIAVFHKDSDEDSGRVVEELFEGHEDSPYIDDGAPVYCYVPVTKLIMALKKDGYSDINVAGILERL